MSAQAIRPCPFCGDACPHVDEVSPKEWAVLCNECGCVGPIEEHGQAPRNAIEAWNRRSLAPGASGENEGPPGDEYEERLIRERHK